MATSIGDKGVLHTPRRLGGRIGRADRTYGETLGLKMGLGAAAGAVLGTGSSLLLVSVVGGAPVDGGEAILALFGGLVGGGYLGAFFGMCATREP